MLLYATTIILNRWLSLYSEYPPSALTRARRRVRHCLIAETISSIDRKFEHRLMIIK